MFTFVAWSCFCIGIVAKIKIGLDQKLSMPKDSYVISYFNDMNSYLNVGPPVYFVVEKGHNYTSIMGQNQLCGSVGCPHDSLLGKLYTQSKISN